MNVLYVLSSLNQSSGIANVAMNYFRNFDKSNLTIDFLCFYHAPSNYDSEVFSAGGNVFYFERPGIFSYAKSKNDIKNFFREHADQYQIVHCHEILVSRLIFPIARRYGTKVCITHAHSDKFSNSFFKSIRNRIISHNLSSISDYCFACSKKSGSVIFGKKILNSKKFRFIPNSICLSDFCFSEEMRLSKRAEFGLTNEFVICHIGRFSKLKNHSFVLSILKECLNKNENLKLLLVGDGELKDHVSQEIKDMCLENHVIMTGNRGDIGGLLSASDVFVLPSLIEGFPVVTLEAQANGLPTLVSDTLTTEIMITDSITMLSLESPSIWADHINQITSNTHKTDNIQKLRHAGFDIKLASCDLLKFYCKQLEIT